MTQTHNSKFAVFLRSRIPDADQLPLEELAKRLGGNVSHGMLSRLRSGTQVIGLKVARRIAKKLAKDPKAQAKLVQELLATRPTAAETALTKSGWESTERAALFTEFRELPRMRRSAPRGQLFRSQMAAWIRRGLHYAMLGPSVLENDRTNEVKSAMASFLNRVHDEGRLAYLDLREELLGQLCSASAPTSESRSAKELVAEADRLDRRLRLYQMTPEAVGTAPALGFRLLVKAQDGRHWRCEWDPNPNEPDAIPERRIVVMEDSDLGEIRAIEERFFPILAFFDTHAELPYDDGQIATYLGNLAIHNVVFHVPNKPRSSVWTLYQPQESAADAVTRIHRAQELDHVASSIARSPNAPGSQKG